MVKHYEELRIGDTFSTPGRTVTKAEIIEFANKYDPQPFHVDALTAKESMFGEIIASGLHTLCIATRLSVDGFLRDSGNEGGLGIDDVRWTEPVYPGDRLQTHIEVVDKGKWRDSSDRGTVTLRRTTENQDDQVVMEYKTKNIFAKSE